MHPVSSPLARRCWTPVCFGHAHTRPMSQRRRGNAGAMQEQQAVSVGWGPLEVASLEVVLRSFELLILDVKDMLPGCWFTGAD